MEKIYQFREHSKISLSALKPWIIMKVVIIIICGLGLLSSYGEGYSQTKKLTFDFENTSIENVLQYIENQSPYSFMYDNKKVDVFRKVDIKVNDETINSILVNLFKGAVEVHQVGEHIIIIPEDERIAKKIYQQAQTISGKITDHSGDPIPGVSVVVKGTNNGTITDFEGRFTLANVPSDASLVFSFVGMISQEIPVAARTTIDVVMEEDAILMEEVVAVGYGIQKKVTLTGAVSAINSENIVTTKSQNIQNALTGKIPGLRVVQKTSEPGVFTNSFDIRGFGSPLIVIDGIPRDNVARLDPNDIESVSVLKDASAAIYGVRAANGVVLITTKKGKEGGVELNYSGYVGWQKPSGLPKTVGAEDWMMMANEKFMHNINNESQPPYTVEDMEEFQNGTRQTANWYPLVIQNLAPQTQHSLSASGSSDKINYFISMGYLSQEGFFKSGDLTYERYNVRSNVSAKITNNLTADLKISAILDDRKKPSNVATREVFKALWRMDPIRPPYANNNPEYLSWIPNAENPIAISNASVSGYQEDKSSWFQSSFSLNYDMPFVKGLSVKGLMSYDHRISNNKLFKKEYNLYEYVELDDSYKAYLYGSPSQIRRSFSENPASLIQASINYNRLFNEKHNISALLLYEEQTREGDNFYAQRDLSISSLDQLLAGNATNQIGGMNADGLFKYTNKGLVGKLNYDYDSKYIAEFSFRYDGSSKFPKGKQWGLFPAVSVGWRISEENFMVNSNALSFINSLKLRASYGIMGDDGASAYQFISGYDYPASRGGNNQRLQGGYIFNNGFVTALDFKNLPNNNITWFEVETLNLGVDADFWNGLLDMQVDVFQRQREGLLATRRLSLPGSLGAALPEENMNSDQVNGVELNLGHRNKIGNINYRISGNISYTRSRLLNYDQAEAGNSYINWRDGQSNRYNDIWWGLDYAGQFQNYDEIYNSDVNYASGNIFKLPGDYKYLDWNGDGFIDGLDDHPIAINNGVPKIYYGFSVAADYKGFDIDVLFQGTEMVNIQYPEQLAAPLWWDGALDYFLDRWRPVDPLANPYNPNTEWETGHYAYIYTEELGTRAIQDASYLRLKSLEVGYTIPKNLISKIGVRNLRFYGNAYNLLTFSKIKYLDPEHPSDDNGYVYPLNKTFNIGVSATF